MGEEEVTQIFHNSGILICEQPKSGTGVFRHFNSNGHVSMEGWMQNGQPVGYVKSFDTDGTHIGTRFWYRLKPLSKKRYHLLCDNDPTLPRFDQVEVYDFMAEDLKLERKRQREEAKKIRERDNTEQKKKSDEFCENKLVQGKAEEAVAWLSDKSCGENTLGELETNAESFKLVRRLHEIGVEKVFAIEVGSHSHGENTGKLIVKLPDDLQKRKRIFRWSDKQARSQGFDPDVDIGQKYLFVMLD